MIYSVHRSKAIFGEDADEFRPERWDNDWQAPKGAFIPFGDGPAVRLRTFAATYLWVELHWAKASAFGNEDNSIAACSGGKIHLEAQRGGDAVPHSRSCRSDPLAGSFRTHGSEIP